MKPDHVNGLFEFVGSLLTWVSAWRTYRDRGYAGVYLPAVILFAAWGLWNLYYYPHLTQWASFAGGCSLVLANAVWIYLMIRYGKIGRNGV